jgi:medium-chain acyl-[acyl-carrier-protein] hydrolase
MASDTSANAWIARPKPNPDARARLFCFPFAGGGVSAFATWWQQLPEEVELCPVQLPGRENRLSEPPVACLATLAETLAEVLERTLDRPYFFFGHSLGAVLCFEVARRLRQRAAPHPLRLFLSARCAPNLSDPRPPLHPLPETEFWAELHRRYGLVSAAFAQSAELKAIFLPILRADFQLIETYKYRPDRPLACPLTVFGGAQDDIPLAQLQAWEDHTSNGLTLRMLPGQHFFLQTSRNALLKAVTEALRTDLARLDAG